MATIEEILKNTYQLTFDNERDYDWMAIAEIIVDSENIEEELYTLQLVNNKESKEDILYWQDLFFMEVAEQGSNFNEDDSFLYEKIKKNSLFKENEKFIRQLPKVTTDLGRELLIDAMIDNEDADKLIPDHIIENALKKKSRVDLRKKFEEWNEEELVAVQSAAYTNYSDVDSYNRKVSFPVNNEKNRLYKILFAIAAILVIGFFVWQPTKLNDASLFKNYAYNDLVKDNISQIPLLNNNTTIATRGDEFNFKGFSKDDSQEAMRGILLIKEGEFHEAKLILSNLDVESKKNEQLLFFLALAQSNSGGEKDALSHFNVLRDVKNFIYKEDVAFQLAMLDLKFGKRREAKQKLEKIVEKGGKYKESAEEVLDKMRWF